MAELVREAGTACHVRQLIEGKQCKFGQAAAAALGVFLHRLGDAHRQCCGERGGRAGPFLGEDAERLVSRNGSSCSYLLALFNRR